MLTDPLSDLSALKTFLRQNYSLEPNSINFNPAGEDGCLYSFQSDKKTYLAKLIGVRRQPNGSDLEASTTVTAKISLLPGFNFVVAPIENTKGTYLSNFQDYYLAVYPFIVGQTQHERGISSQELAEIGQYVGKLHSLSIDDYKNLNEDSFDINEALILEKYLQKIDEWVHNKTFAETAKMLLPWKDKLSSEIDTYKLLHKKMLARSQSKKIVHGDLSPGNIIFSENGIKVIDWEGLHLSFPEQDVNIFSSSEHISHFLPAYLETAQIKLDIEAFAYYKYQWELEGISERVTMIINPKASSAQRKHEIDELRDELDGHKWLEVGIEIIEKELLKFI